MNFSVKRTGQVSCITIIILVILFATSIIVFPQNNYLSFENYLKDFHVTRLFPVVPSFLLVLANIPLFAALFYFSGHQKRIYGLTGTLFGMGYMVCSGINYFLQLSMVIKTISGSSPAEVIPFLMTNPNSFAYSVDNLGYLFLSLSFMFFSGIFNQHGLQSWIKSTFIIFSIAGISGTLGYILNIRILESMVLLSALPYLTCIVLLFVEFRRYTIVD
jgi:hypothetical protein